MPLFGCVRKIWVEPLSVSLYLGLSQANSRATAEENNVTAGEKTDKSERDSLKRSTVKRSIVKHSIISVVMGFVIVAIVVELDFHGEPEPYIISDDESKIESYEPIVSKLSAGRICHQYLVNDITSTLDENIYAQVTAIDGYSIEANRFLCLGQYREINNPERVNQFYILQPSRKLEMIELSQAEYKEALEHEVIKAGK